MLSIEALPSSHNSGQRATLGLYLEPGHVPVFEEDTEILEFSPKDEYQQTIDVVNKNIGTTESTK